MKYVKQITFAATLMVGLAAAPSASAGRIVCWTNEDGVRECGNSLPPRYAQQGSEEKSSQGITVKRTARAKTKDELAAERVERQRLDKEEQERQRLDRERRQYDRVLLATFTTEEDLMLTRDGKVAAIESRIKHVQQVGKKLEKRLVQLQAEAARLERAGKPVTDKLQKQITGVQTQIKENREEVTARENEMVAVKERFRVDLARYRELKGIN